MKNLHDIIQKNSEMFDEKFCKIMGNVIMWNRDTPNAQIKATVTDVKSHLLSSQLSIIQAIDEWAEKNKYEIEKGLDELGRPKEPSKIMEISWTKGFNTALSDLRYFLNEAKTKLQ